MNASVQMLVELETFVLRVLHVDYVDRVVIRFEVPVLVPGLFFLVHRADEGQEYGQCSSVFGPAAWNHTTFFDCVLFLGVPDMAQEWSRPFFDKFLVKQFRTAFLSCMSLYPTNAQGAPPSGSDNAPQVQSVTPHRSFWTPADFLSFFVCLVCKNFQPVERRDMLDVGRHRHLHELWELFQLQAPSSS